MFIAFAVFEVSNIYGMERNLTGLSMMPVEVSCVPLRTYESFAGTLGVDESLLTPSTHVLTKNFMFWLDVDVGYSGMLQGTTANPHLS